MKPKLPSGKILGPFDLYGPTGNDPLLRGRRELVVQIFRLVDYPENLEVSVAALHAIADMAESPVFASTSNYSPHKLYSILEAAGELPNVMESFIRRLEREETEQVSLFAGDDLKFLERGLEEGDGFIAAFGLANLVRLQILDFLMINAKKPGYNLAHYLLGFNNEMLRGAITAIAAPGKEGSDYNCFHMILELLSYGLGQPSTPIIALDHPGLGQKCYELLNILLSNKLTATAVANYLRRQEDFYRNQLIHFSRTPVDLTDVGYTILEFHQKAALFRGTALDLHLSFMEGSWSYARKLVTVMVRGDREEVRKSPENLPGVNNTLTSVHLKCIEDVLSSEYLYSFPPTVQATLLHSVASVVQAIFRSIELVLVDLDRAPYDRQTMISLQHKLLTSMVPLVCKLQSNPHTTSPILNSCAIFSVALSGYFQRSSNELSSILAGDEIMSLTNAAIQGILRPEASIFARGYWYSSFCDCFPLSLSDVNALNSIKSLIKHEIYRLVEVASSDSAIPSAGADGWKTMAITFLRLLLSENDTIVTDKILKIGFLKTLVVSLRTDDRNLLGLLDPSVNNQSLNSLYLWRARLGLLELIATDLQGTERLIEAGICDYILSLRILDSDHILDDSTAITKHRRGLILLPLFRFLAVIAASPIAVAKSSIKAIVSARPGSFTAVLCSANEANCLLSDESLELIAKTSFIITEVTQSREMCKLFMPSIINILYVMSGELSSLKNLNKDINPIISVIRSSLQFLINALKIHNESMCFTLDSTETIDELGSYKLSMSVIIRIIDFYISSLPDETATTDSTRLILMTIEQVMFLLCMSFGHRYPTANEPDMRHFTFLVPTLEQLSELSRKAPDRFESVSRCINFLNSKMAVRI